MAHFFDEFSVENCPIVIMFGTLITQKIGNRMVVDAMSSLKKENSTDER